MVNHSPDKGSSVDATNSAHTFSQNIRMVNYEGNVKNSDLSQALTRQKTVKESVLKWLASQKVSEDLVALLCFNRLRMELYRINRQGFVLVAHDLIHRAIFQLCPRC